jgi:hypothetical protein
MQIAESGRTAREPKRELEERAKKFKSLEQTQKHMLISKFSILHNHREHELFVFCCVCVFHSLNCFTLPLPSTILLCGFARNDCSNNKQKPVNCIATHSVQQLCARLRYFLLRNEGASVLRKML